MANLSRVRSVWVGVAGSPYYTNTFFDGGPGGTFSPQDANDAVEDFLASIKSELDDQLVVQNDPEVAIVDSTTGLIVAFQSVETAPIACQGAGDPLPPANQLLLRHRTGTVVNGRRLQGRTFIPGCRETSSGASGTPDAGFASGVQDAWTATIGATDAHVIYSRKNFVQGAVQTTTYWNQWAVLRSRRD